MIYIVVPCYNEEDVLLETNRQLLALTERVEGDVRLLYVDDGSRDQTWPIIARLGEESPRVCGLRLAHNIGHQRAVWAGMEAVAETAEAVITIDADLQDDIDVIPRMIDDFRRGADIVYGVRRERKTDSWFKRRTALAFYWLMKRMNTGTVYNHADFRLLSHRALSALMRYPERNLFLRGMVPLLGFNSQMEYYDRSERMAGESKYPLSKMLALALDGITSFSVTPLRWILAMGVAFIFVAICVIVYALSSHWSGHTVSGWTSLLISVWFVGGVLLLALGIVGEYVGKVYSESKQRPRWQEWERVNL